MRLSVDYFFIYPVQHLLCFVDLRIKVVINSERYELSLQALGGEPLRATLPASLSTRPLLPWVGRWLIQERRLGSRLPMLSHACCVFLFGSWLQGVYIPFCSSALKSFQGRLLKGGGKQTGFQWSTTACDGVGEFASFWDTGGRRLLRHVYSKVPSIRNLAVLSPSAWI